MQAAIRAWINCPKDKRPSARALGQQIERIASGVAGDLAQTAPHVPAAFINALAEEGTREELVKYLQQTWNELCQARSSVPQERRCQKCGRATKGEEALV